MLILIAGPYRSGTGNDPELIKRNMEKLEAVALPIFRKGHVPIIGEWVANPIMQLAGSKSPGDAVFNEIQYPVAHRLLQKCDAVLRIEGASAGADQDVELARKLGLLIYWNVDDIPSELPSSILHLFKPYLHSFVFLRRHFRQLPYQRCNTPYGIIRMGGPQGHHPGTFNPVL